MGTDLTAAEKTEKEIVESILIHSAESSNNHKAANKHFWKYTKLICRALQEDTGLLYKFIAHEEPAVRCTGAYYLLQTDKKAAEKTLKSLYKIQKDSIGFNAKMIMREWKSKRLKFPALKEGKILYK